MTAESPEQRRLIDFEMRAGPLLHIDLFAGTTTPEQRKLACRVSIKACGYAARIISDEDGWETWTSRFERMYGEAL